jgi:hypothetical protein
MGRKHDLGIFIGLIHKRGRQNYHRVDGESGMVERTGKVMEIIAWMNRV